MLLPRCWKTRRAGLDETACWGIGLGKASTASAATIAIGTSFSSGGSVVSASERERCCALLPPGIYLAGKREDPTANSGETANGQGAGLFPALCRALIMAQIGGYLLPGVQTPIIGVRFCCARMHGLSCPFMSRQVTCFGELCG